MRRRKKHPCPDCRVCLWCSDARCAVCQGWLVGKKASACAGGRCDARKKRATPSGQPAQMRAGS